MRDELQNKLYEDFPELFAQHKLSIYESGMSWGIECYDGWEPVIRTLCETIKRQGNMMIHKKFPPGYKKCRTLLHNICRKIERVLRIPTYTLYKAKYDDFACFPGWKIEFCQIKEKFGTLRIYFDVIPLFEERDVQHLDKTSIDRAYARFVGKVDGAIAFAENLSSSTCEKHGTPGKLYTSGWWKTLCEDCARESNKNNLNE